MFSYFYSVLYKYEQKVYSVYCVMLCNAMYAKLRLEKRHCMEKVGKLDSKVMSHVHNSFGLYSFQERTM